MPATQSPKSVAELVRLVAKHGKRVLLSSGIDMSAERSAAGKVVVDLAGIGPLHEIVVQKDKICIGTGMNLGRLAREAPGENGLIRQAASLIANPLVRNKVTFLQALDLESPYFDITTPLVLLDAKVRMQSPTGKRTMSIRDFLDAATKGLKKGEIPVAIEYTRLPGDDRVGFFRVARMGGKGSVSAATRMKLVRQVCMAPEIVVSSLTLIPLRSKMAEKEIAGKPATEEIVKKASAIAAHEILEMSDSDSSYERSLIEIAVARTLRTILEGSLT